MAEILRLESSPLTYRIIGQEDIDQLYAIYPDLPRNCNFGCPSCGKDNGNMRDGYVILNGVTYQCNCQDQLQRHKHYLNAGIGMAYQTLSWADYHGDPSALTAINEYREKLDANIESGKGLMLFGGYGVGKSMLCYLVLKECVMAGYKCFATTYADMLASMKAGWKDPQFAQWYKSKVDSAQVLMLDDVGKELFGASGHNDDFAKQTLDSLFRTRVQQSRPTFITTNLNTTNLREIYGEAFFSLMTESMSPILVNGFDYRGAVKTQGKGARRIY